MTGLRLKQKSKPEGRLQRQIVAGFRRRAQAPGLLFSVPNDLLRDRGQAAGLKALGLEPGAPDLVLVGPDGVAFIEVKTADGELSERQERARAAVDQCGQRYRVVRSLDAFERVAAEVGVSFDG